MTRRCAAPAWRASPLRCDPVGVSAPRHPDLVDARESLEYWERRLAGLPKRDKRGRREAAEAITRARARVVEAERAAYGEGIGAQLVQVATEGRLPEPLRDTGRRVAKHGRRAVVAAVALTAALTVLVLVAAIAVVLALLGII